MGGKSINWEECDHMLGKRSDDKTGREIGCASSTVRKRRLELGIVPHGPTKRKEPAPKIKWHLWDKKIGTTSDSKLAQQIGCRVWTVTRRRDELGKPSFRGGGRCQRDEWERMDIRVLTMACRVLWMEVLDRAFKDLNKTTKSLRGRGSRDHRNIRVSGEIRSDDQILALWKSTVRWFQSENDKPGSFVWICHMLDTEEIRFQVDEIRARSLMQSMVDEEAV